MGSNSELRRGAYFVPSAGLCGGELGLLTADAPAVRKIADRPLTRSGRTAKELNLRCPVPFVVSPSNHERIFLTTAEGAERGGNSRESIRQLTSTLRQMQTLAPWQRSPEWSVQVIRLTSRDEACAAMSRVSSAGRAAGGRPARSTSAPQRQLGDRRGAFRGRSQDHR